MRKPFLAAFFFTSVAFSVSAGDLPLPPPPPLPTPQNSAPPAPTNSLPSASAENLLPPLPAFDNGLPTQSIASDFSFDSPIAISVGDDDEVGGTLGTITGGRVHIRAGDNTKYEIVHTGDSGMTVHVFEKKGDWVQIAFPSEESCFIEQRAIDGDLPLDIPDQGAVRSLRADAKIYARSWNGSTVVGELKSGDNVVITGMRGQFLRIKPPKSARAWVFAKYVKYDGTNVENVELTPEEKAAKEEADLRAAVDNAKKSVGTVGESKVLAARRNDPLLQKIRERSAQERAAREQQREQAKLLISNLDKTLAAIDDDAVARMNEVAKDSAESAVQDEQIRRSIEENYRPGPLPGSLGNSATGWIEHVGNWRNRPAEYRLVKGRETVCYLRSNRFNLGDYNGRHVVVNGPVTASPTGAGEIVQVEILRLFDETVAEQPPVIPPYVTPTREAADAPVFYPGPNEITSSSTTNFSRSTNVSQSNIVRPADRRYSVYSEPVLQQNENVVIIEDSSNRAISSDQQWNDHSQTGRVGEVIDVTGIPTIGR